MTTVHLQWLEHWWLVYRGWFEHVFESLGNSYDSSRKQIIRDISGKFSYRENVCCVYSLESPHRGDSDEYTQDTIILYKVKKTSLNIPICLLTYLSDSRPNFHGPKEVWATEVPLFWVSYTKIFLRLLSTWLSLTNKIKPRFCTKSR